MIPKIYRVSVYEYIVRDILFILWCSLFSMVGVKNEWGYKNKEINKNADK